VKSGSALPFFEFETRTPVLALPVFELAARLLSEFASRVGSGSTSDDRRRSDEELSIRQRQILELLAGNLSYKEIALMLKLSEATVKYHMGQILERLHLLNRAEAVAYARRLRQK
jgi:two-component system NarL family response regulator